MFTPASHTPAQTHPPPQNDFLRPFVVVMRHSRALEIRELIIRCVSQMVLARVANVKSGWKSMFMVRGQQSGEQLGLGTSCRLKAGNVPCSVHGPR